MNRDIGYSNRLKLLGALLGFSTLHACKNTDKTTTSVQRPAQESLLGTWVSQCTAESGSFFIASVTFTPNTHSLRSEEFSDPACRTPTIVDDYKMDKTSTYKLGSPVKDPAGAIELDLTAFKAVFTISSDDFLSVFNGTDTRGRPICGGSFIKNVPTEKTARDCAGDSAFGDLFNTEYTIYKLDGSKLYIGDPSGVEIGKGGNDGSTPSQRIKKILNFPLTRAGGL